MLPTLFMIDEVIDRGGDVQSVRRIGELPFLPVVGMDIACGNGDDYRTVSCVQWHAGEGVLYVTFEHEEVADLQMVIDQGWEVASDG